MAKNLFRDIFGFSDSEIEKLIDGASEWIEDLIAESIKDEKTKSYFNTKGCLFDDGKLTEKYEKEYVNGKCTKDEHYEAPKTIKDNTTDECKDSESRNDLKKINRNASLVKKVKSQSTRISELTEENNALMSQIKDMTSYIDGLNDKIKKVELEKAELKAIVDNIKKCF